MARARKKIVIVGAGIIGASIAYRLTRAGCDVTVLEADESGGLATRHSFAWINASWGNPEFYVHFRRRAMAEWRQLAIEVPAIGVNFCGGLIWDLPAPELDAFATEHEGWGYGVRRVDRTGALAVEPGLKAPPDFALHVAEEGMVEPVVAALALLSAAGIVPVNARAISLIFQAGQVTGVATDIGPFHADEVVLAAGAQTALLAGTAGLSLAMTAPAGLIAHSERAGAQLLRGLVLSPQFHVRQTAEGRLIVGSDFAGHDPKDEGQAMAERLLAQVRDMVRGSEGLALDFFSVGHRPTPADGFPLIGRPGETPGLYVAVMHSGVTLAPLVGMLAAKELAAGDRDPLLAPYDPDRLPIG